MSIRQRQVAVRLAHRLTRYTVVHDCGFNANNPPSAGVQKTAQWVRTAFHDAATHDASAKTGGLDASIQFELGRPEDFGAALNQTLADISSDYTTQTSAADLLALAFVLSVGVCSNFHVPLRLGRIDATHAGPFGVPEPQTDLSTTTKRFDGMGFSQCKQYCHSIFESILTARVQPI